MFVSFLHAASGLYAAFGLCVYMMHIVSLRALLEWEVLVLDAESLGVLMIISRTFVLNPALRKFRITRSSKTIQIS